MESKREYGLENKCVFEVEELSQIIVNYVKGANMYIPTRQSTLHGVLVHDFRRYSARFPVISACGLFRYRYSGFC